MTCGCTDNKIGIVDNKIGIVDNKIGIVDNKIGIVDNKIDNKILNLEDMKNMSIDDIVGLYQDGYKIETMQYGNYCSGSVTVDKQNTNAPSDLNVHLYEAFAQKVKPTNKCLNSIILRIAVDSTYPNDMYVEIRESNPSTGLPIGDPQTAGNLGSYVISQASIARYPNFGDITIPLNILLSDTHTTNGIWIVACLNVYDATSADPFPYAFMKNGVSGTSTEYMAFKSGTLQWQGNTSWNLYFKTNKQTYSAPPVLTTITISPTSATVNVGSTRQFSAICKDQNNATMTCPTLTWNSSNALIGTISNAGLFTAVASGTTNVTASAAGVTSNAAPVTVPAPTLTTITLSPSSATLSPGGIQLFTPTCKDQNNVTMTCPTLTWTVDNTAIGTVTQGGVFTAGSTAGTTTVRATSGSVVGTAGVTVSVPTLNTITLSPASITLSPGGIQTFTATCKDQNNNTMTCPTLTWTVDNTAIGTVTQGGVFTAGSTAGSTTVRATSGTKSGTASVTVSTATPVLTTIQVSPSTASVAPSGTQQFSAICKDQFNNTMTCPTITWSSDNTNIGTVSPTTGTSTTFTAITVGTTIVRATSGTKSGTASVTVTTAPPPSAGAGAGLAIAAVAAIAIAYFVLRPKPPVP